MCKQISKGLWQWASVTLLMMGFCGMAQADFDALWEEIAAAEQRLGGKVSVAVLNTENKYLWQHRGYRNVAITSTFKPLLCAKVLSDAEAQFGLLQKEILISPEDLQEYSPVTGEYKGKALSVGALCEATLATSDNTAANLLLRQIGGPARLTEYLRDLGDETTRVDHYEPELNRVERRSTLNTTTAVAISNTLNRLMFEPHLSAESRQQLSEWMRGNRVSDRLLRSVLPEGWLIADRSGAGAFGARSIVAVLWPQKHPPVVVAIYISHTMAPMAKRDMEIARLGKVVFQMIGEGVLNPQRR